MNNKLKIILIIAIFLIGIVIKGEQTEGGGVLNYKVSSGSTLEISIMQGDIDIKTWDNNELVLSSMTDEDDEMPITLKQEGNTYTVVNKRNSFIWGSADLEIKIPKKMNLKINSSNSDIDLRGTLEADLRISIGAGDISTDNVSGDILVKTSGGDIRMGSLKGKIEVNTFGGDIRINSIISDKLIKIETAGGDIKLGKAEGESKISTYGGTIYVEEAKKEGNIVSNGGDIIVKKIEGKYKIKTYGGDINVEEGKGNFIVETGGGTIKVKNITGSVRAKTYAGDIFLGLIPTGGDESSAKTSSGDVHFYLPNNQSALVEVKVTGGFYEDSEEKPIESDYSSSSETKGKMGGSYFCSYNINGGKNKIYIETNNGSVSIKKNRNWK